MPHGPSPSPRPPPVTAGEPAGALAQARLHVRRLLKAYALAAIDFVVARPRLDGFLRRQIYRFPGLSGRVRAAVARSRRADWQTLPDLPSEETQLTDSARQVLHDLKRAIEHRQP